VRTVWHALWAAGSPLADNGPRNNGKTYAEYIWDEGKATGIDPAIVMGIFRQESSYGTQGMAVLTHSLGNMRPMHPGAQLCGGDGCYQYEPNWFRGIDDIYRLLRRYVARGYATADQLIPTWAPPGDFNDDAIYSFSVHQTMHALNAAS